jgi:mRNA interferase HigB
MRVIAHRTLVKFYSNRPDAKTSIENWYIKTSSAGWHSFAEVKKDFNSLDSVGNQHYVFNLKGNDYRLVVVIKFQMKMVYIRFIGTHSEYNKIDCSNI